MSTHRKTHGFSFDEFVWKAVEAEMNAWPTILKTRPEIQCGSPSCAGSLHSNIEAGICHEIWAWNSEVNIMNYDFEIRLSDKLV